MLHLRGTAHVEIHIVPPGLQVLDRPVQLLHRRRDPLGEPQVHEHQQEDGKQHHEQEKQHQLAVIAPKALPGHHGHQLPARVAHGLDRHLPALALELLFVAAVGIAGGQVVLLLEPRVDELLAGVVDDLAAVVDEIEVAPVVQLHVLADLLDAVKAHVQQQHTAFDAAAPGELHVPAQGYHPPVALVHVRPEVLHMGRGKMQVFDLVHGLDEPVLPLGGDAVFQRAQRRGGDQLPVLGEHGHGDDGIPVAGVEELQRRGQAVLVQVDVLDDVIVGGVRNAHHAPEVRVQVPVHLGEELLAVFRLLGVGGVGKAQKQGQSHEHHAHHSHGGERQRQDHLDAAAAVESLPPAPDCLPYASHAIASLSTKIHVPPSPARYLVGVTPKWRLKT